MKIFLASLMFEVKFLQRWQGIYRVHTPDVIGASESLVSSLCNTTGSDWEILI